MTILRTAALFVAVAAIGACTAPQAIRTQELAGTEWMLVEMEGLPVVMAPERPFFLAFGGDGKVNGQACNHFSGEYRLQGQRIIIGQVAMTEMSCGEAMDRVEGRFLQILSAPLDYRFAPEGDLLLGDPDQPALRLLPRTDDGN